MVRGDSYQLLLRQLEAMSTTRVLYKKKARDFRDEDALRSKKALHSAAARAGQRLELVNARRGVSVASSSRDSMDEADCGTTSRGRLLQRWKEERAVRRQLLGNQVQRAPFRPPSRNPSPFPATLGHSSSSVRKGTTATCTPSWSLQARGSALPATTGSKLFVPRQTMKDATRVTRSTTVRRGLDLGSPAKEVGLAAASGATAAVPGASVAARKMAAPEKPRKLAFKENPSFAPAGFQFRGLHPLKPVLALQPWNGQRQGHGSRSCTKVAAAGPPPSGGRFVNNENIRGGHHLRPKPVKCPVGNLMDFS